MFGKVVLVRCGPVSVRKQGFRGEQEIVKQSMAAWTLEIEKPIY